MTNNNQNLWGNNNQDAWGNSKQDVWGNNQSPEENNPWLSSQGQILNNPYQENIYEQNNFDSAYTETFANPDPKNEQDWGRSMNNEQ